MIDAPNGTHRAIVRRGSRSHVEYRRLPEPAAGELCLAPEKVSLCGTDIQILRGDRDDPSSIVGHEGAARVHAVGAGVVDFAVGDRVIVNPTHPHDSAFLLGHNVEGLFQQRVNIAASAVSGGLVSPLAGTLTSARATLIEPYAVVRYALACLAALTPDSLVIYGDGLIGNLAAHMARRVLFPTVRVTLVHRSSGGLRWSEQHGPTGTAHCMVGDGALTQARGGNAAVLIATHRGGTVGALEAAIDTLGTGMRGVHLVGGLSPGAASPLVPGVDLNGVRHANTGGPWPPTTTLFSSERHRMVLSGNRGVSNAQLCAAATELESWGDELDALLSHQVDIDEGVRYINEICAGHSRMVDNELVMRLVVGLNE